MSGRSANCELRTAKCKFAICHLPFAIAFVVVGLLAAMPARAAVPQDLLFLADSRPVLLRLQILADGQPCLTAHEDAWGDYLKHLFRHLDRNGDRDWDPDDNG